MAVKVQPVLGDVGSDELFLLESAFNGLMDALFDVTTVDITTLQAAILARPEIVKMGIWPLATLFRWTSPAYPTIVKAAGTVPSDGSDDLFESSVMLNS